MGKELNLYDHFEHLKSIEPSAEWSESLKLRLRGKSLVRHNSSGGRWVIYAIFLLLAINLLSYSRDWLEESAQRNALNMKSIASEYLITSNSSNY